MVRTAPISAPFNPIAQFALDVERLRTDDAYEELPTEKIGDLLQLSNSAALPAGGAPALEAKPAPAGPLLLGVDNTLGIGHQYQLPTDDDTMLLGRMASRVKPLHPGVSEEQQFTELLLGCQIDRKFDERNKLTSNVEFARDVADLANVHIRRRVAWEVLLDSEKNVSLRTGVLESANYAPNREPAKNVNYNLDLIWKF